MRARARLHLVALVLLAACGSSASTPAPGAAPAATDAAATSSAAAPSTTVVASTAAPTMVPATTTTTTAPPPYRGPFEVRQTSTPGNGVATGTVCDLAVPFDVTLTRFEVTFPMHFTPDAGVEPAALGRTGAVAYEWFDPAQNEGWTVSGEYIVSRPEPDGTVHLGYQITSLSSVRYGKFIERNSFDLVPVAAC